MDINVAAGGSTLLDVTAINLGASYTAITGVTTTTDSLVLNLAAGKNIIITQAVDINGAPINGIHFYGMYTTATSVGYTLKNQNPSEAFFGITAINRWGAQLNMAGVTIPLTENQVGSYNVADEANMKQYSAFFMSSRGYGSFFNTFSDGNYAFGNNAATTVTHNTNTLDWYVYYGPTGDKIYPGYFKTIGVLENLTAGRSPVKKVPIWACGLVPWHDNDNSSSSVVNMVNSYKTNTLPITACWLDRPYSNGGNGWGQMDFSSAFANPATWIATLNSPTGNNVKFMTWISPATWGDPVPSVKYFNDGTYYYIDLSDPAAATWYKGKLVTNQENNGVQGHKLDRADEGTSAIQSTAWTDGTPSGSRAKKYMYLNPKVTDEALRSVYGDDQFLFPRSCYHRVQPYLNGVWAGDTRGAAQGGYDGTIANGLKTAFIGITNWGSDVGGYVSEKTAALTMLRWNMVGCFSGFYENKLDGREPWTYTDVMTDGKNYLDNYRDILNLRQSLIPYTYSVLNSAADQGGLMRPLPYMYPSDVSTYAQNKEWLFGPAILVAPLPYNGTTRSVYLPAGTWYDFFSPASAATTGPTTLASVTAPENQIPAWVKGNSIYVTGSIYPGNSKNWITNFDAQRNLVINAFPGAAGEQVTFPYVDYLDKDTKKNIVLTSSGNDAAHLTCPALTIMDTVKVHLSAAPSKGVTLNGVTLTASQYTWDAATLTLCVPSSAGAAINLYVGPTTRITRSPMPSALGRLHFSVNKSGCFLIVPAAIGLNNNSRITASVATLSGRLVWKGSVKARNIVNGEYKMPLTGIASGSYISQVDIDGGTAAQARIIVP
jgi:alpha-glucosidase (family GH31 glycosyl hydrolase)